MVDYSPDSYSETAFVAISTKGGTEHEFMTITETVDIDIGAKEFDVVNTIGGGRLVKFSPQEPTEITLDAYPVQVSQGSGGAGAAGLGFLDLMYTTSDTTQPIRIQNDRTRTKIRCAVLWTSDTSVSSATAATTGTNAAFRIVAKNGYMTSYKESFTDGVKKATVKMKFPAFGKDGSANVYFESTDGSANLSAFGTYT